MKTPYQIGEGYEDEVTRNCVIWEVKERDHAIHTLLRESCCNDCIKKIQLWYDTPEKL